MKVLWWCFISSAEQHGHQEHTKIKAFDLSSLKHYEMKRFYSADICCQWTTVNLSVFTMKSTVVC